MPESLRNILLRFRGFFSNENEEEELASLKGSLPLFFLCCPEIYRYLVFRDDVFCQDYRMTVFTASGYLTLNCLLKDFATAPEVLAVTFERVHVPANESTVDV